MNDGLIIIIIITYWEVKQRKRRRQWVRRLDSINKIIGTEELSVITKDRSVNKGLSTQSLGIELLL